MKKLFVLFFCFLVQKFINFKKYINHIKPMNVRIYEVAQFIYFILTAFGRSIKEPVDQAVNHLLNVLN